MKARGFRLEHCVWGVVIVTVAANCAVLFSSHANDGEGAATTTDTRAKSDLAREKTHALAKHVRDHDPDRPWDPRHPFNRADIEALLPESALRDLHRQHPELRPGYAPEEEQPQARDSSETVDSQENADVATSQEKDRPEPDRTEDRMLHASAHVISPDQPRQGEPHEPQPQWDKCFAVDVQQVRTSAFILSNIVACRRGGTAHRGDSTPRRAGRSA